MVRIKRQAVVADVAAIARHAAVLPLVTITAKALQRPETKAL
jgi:hypothetical protein